MTSCQRCGKELPPGSLKYLLTIHVTADFDGALPSGASAEDLEAFMQQLDAKDPTELERDVYQSQGYLVCPACKAEVLKDPLGAKSAAPGRGEGRVH